MVLTNRLSVADWQMFQNITVHCVEPESKKEKKQSHKRGEK